MEELWGKIVTFMTDEAFKISTFSVLWWYVIVAAAAVVVLLLIVTIAVACSKKKKKKAKKAQEAANAVTENAESNSENAAQEEKSFKEVTKEISPDWQPVPQAGDKPIKANKINEEITEENNEVIEEVKEEPVEVAPIAEVVTEKVAEEKVVAIKPESVPAPIKQVKPENIPAPIKEVKPESVPAPIKQVKAESVPAPIKEVKVETVPAPVKTEVVEEVTLEPIAVQSEPKEEIIEEPVVNESVTQVESEPVKEEVAEQVVEKEVVTPVYVQKEEVIEQEAVATTAPRTLPKKNTKTTKKTAAQIANEIEEKTGTNPRKKAASDKPAVVGKDKLPKKTAAKAKKEEPVESKQTAAKVAPDELPLITTDPNVESFGKFVIIKNDDNSTRPYHFRLLANNGQILFESESYKTKPKSNSIIAFKKVCVIENFEIDMDKANNWRYKLYNNAHTVIGVGESYSTKQGCENSVQSVIKFAESARYLEDQSE